MTSSFSGDKARSTFHSQKSFTDVAPRNDSDMRMANQDSLDYRNLNQNPFGSEQNGGTKRSHFSQVVDSPHLGNLNMPQTRQTNSTLKQNPHIAAIRLGGAEGSRGTGRNSSGNIKSSGRIGSQKSSRKGLPNMASLMIRNESNRFAANRRRVASVVEGTYGGEAN